MVGFKAYVIAQYVLKVPRKVTVDPSSLTEEGLLVTETMDILVHSPGQLVR